MKEALDMSDVIHRVTERLRALPPDVAEAVDAALADVGDPDPLDPAVWGPPPAPSEVVEASVRASVRVTQARTDALDGALTRKEAAERLGITPQAVSARVAGGRLVAGHVGRELRLPPWQFDDEAPDGVLPALGLVTAELPGGLLTLYEWLRTPNPALDDRAPRQALLDGDADRTVMVARAFGA